MVHLAFLSFFLFFPETNCISINKYTMSGSGEKEFIEKPHEKNEDAFLDDSQVAETVEEDPNADAPMDDEEGDDDVEGAEEMELDDQGHDIGINADGNIELDMSNNSSAYFDKHEDSIFLIASHPTLPMVMTGGGDDIAYLWTTNSDTPVIVATLDGQTESVISGGFTFDGNFAITGDMAGQIRIWKSKKRGQKWEFFERIKEVEEIVWITFHPKQPVFAFGASDGSVWVYSLENGSLSSVSVLMGHHMTTNGGVFFDVNNADSLSLITIADDSIISWNCYTSTANYTLRENDLNNKTGWVSNAISISGETIAVGAQDGSVALISLSSGNVFKLFSTLTSDDIPEEARSVEAIAWCKAMPILAVGNVNGEVIIYDTATFNIRRTFKVKDALTSLKFVGGSTTLIGSDYSGAIIKWDVRSGEQKWEGKGHYAGILGFVVQSEGKRIITAGDEGVALIFKDE